MKNLAQYIGYKLVMIIAAYMDPIALNKSCFFLLQFEIQKYKVNCSNKPLLVYIL